VRVPCIHGALLTPASEAARGNGPCLEQIFTESTPIHLRTDRKLLTEGKANELMATSSPIDVGSGWLNWAVVVIVLIAFWAIPIAATLTLFRGNASANRRKGPRGQCR
jgi:hypothetical protein